MRISKKPLVRVELGIDGAAFMHSALAGGLTLSRLLLDTGRITDSAFTFAPAGTRRSRLVRWHEGGLLSTERGLEALVSELRPLLEARPAVLVAENAMAVPSEDIFKTRSGARFFCGREVYEYCEGPSARDHIGASLRSADAGYTLNAVVACGVRPPAASEDVSYLEVLARATRLVVTRAYDGEGFVLWRAAESG